MPRTTWILISYIDEESPDRPAMKPGEKSHPSDDVSEERAADVEEITHDAAEEADRCDYFASVE